MTHGQLDEDPIGEENDPELGGKCPKFVVERTSSGSKPKERFRHRLLQDSIVTFYRPNAN